MLSGDGKISFEEFKECMYDKMSQETVDEDLKEAFMIFDEDGDGYISPDEIQLLFKKLGELISTDEAVDIMKDCDLNQDGLIDFEGKYIVKISRFIHKFEQFRSLPTLLL